MDGLYHIPSQIKIPLAPSDPELCRGGVEGLALVYESTYNNLSMIKLFSWIVIYTSILAFSQILLKLGLNKIGSFSIKEAKDILSLGSALLTNPYVVLGTILMASSYFLWLAILSWFKLSLAFPLTSLGFVFVALFSYRMLGEKLLFHNYLGIGLIAVGIFLLLFKQLDV